VEDWVELDEHNCRCHGYGWAEFSNDVWKECPIHYEGQLHPDTRALLIDDPQRLAEEARKSYLQYNLKEVRARVINLQIQLRTEQERLVTLELELINRTPTVKAMPAARVIEIDITSSNGDSK
jgi:hypothetical protein